MNPKFIKFIFFLSPPFSFPLSFCSRLSVLHTVSIILHSFTRRNGLSKQCTYYWLIFIQQVRWQISFTQHYLASPLQFPMKCLWWLLLLRGWKKNGPTSPGPYRKLSLKAVSKTKSGLIHSFHSANMGTTSPILIFLIYIFIII